MLEKIKWAKKTIKSFFTPPKRRLGICSLYANPLHQGHIEYLNAAKALCDHLFVIVNNDKQVELKGSKKFQNQAHRYFIIKNLKAVDTVAISCDNDLTVRDSLRLIHSMSGYFNEITFYNSGDRKPSDPNNPSPETILCAELGIKKEFLDLPKIYSSSELVK